MDYVIVRIIDNHINGIIPLFYESSKNSAIQRSFSFRREIHMSRFIGLNY